MTSTQDVALTGPELGYADGTHTIRVGLLAVASTTIATALINQAAFTFPLIVLTVDNTSAGWANVAVGHDVWVGTTAGAKDIGVYRVKQAGDATHIYIGEVANGDFGTIPIGIRSAGFADNQFITVVQRYSAHSVLPLITGGVVYEDYNQTVTDENTYPAPLVTVKCSTTKKFTLNHIAAPVDAGQTYATVTFLADTSLWPTSSSATFLYTVPGSWTITAGAANTQTFTAQIPRAGKTNYVLELTVTENNGNVQLRHIMVWVYDWFTPAYAPIPIAEYSSDGWDWTGAKASFTLYDNDLADIDDGAMVCIVQEPTFGGNSITSAVTQLVGWLLRANKRTEPGLRSAELEFVSPSGLLDKRRGTSQIWTAVSGTPDTWQKVPTALSTYSFAMWWMARNRFRGLLELFDFNVYSTATGGQWMPVMDVAGGNFWTQHSTLAEAIQKRTIGCDPDGTFWVTQHPSLGAYPRTGIVKRDTLTASRYQEVDWPREYVPQVGLIEGEAFMWDGVQPQPTPLLSLAPGFAPGQGAADEKVQSQIVDSQATLNALIGHYYAMRNPDYTDPTIHTPDNRGALYKPAQGQMVRLQIPRYLDPGAPDGPPNDITFDRYFIPREVQRTFTKLEDGSLVVDSRITGEIETAGVPAATKPVPPANSNMYAGTTIIAPPTAITGGLAARDLYKGVTKLAAFDTAGYLYRTSNFSAATPTWTRTATGVDGSLINFAVDAFSPRYLNTGTQVNGWIVTTKKIYRIADIFGSPSVTLQYTFVATVDQAIDANTAQWARSFDFSFGLQNWGICVSNYRSMSGHNGHWATYTRDGVNWSAETAITTFYQGSSLNNFRPGLHISSKAPGLAWASAFTATATGAGAVNRIYKSSDYGASWTLQTPTNWGGGNSAANNVYSPFEGSSSDSIFYFSGYNYDTALWPNVAGELIGRLNADGSLSDITPIISAQRYRTSARISFHACPVDHLSLLTEVSKFDATSPHVLVSRDGGNTWSSISTGSYQAGNIAGDNRDVLYVWGVDGIKYSENFGTSLSDKIVPGTFSTPNVAEIIGIAGG